MWDARSGQPLTDVLEQGGYLFSAQFTANGERVLTASFEGAPMVWYVAPSSAKYPEWLLLLAEAICGQSLNEQNLLQPTELERAEIIDQVRQKMHEKPGDDDCAVWGRWFLAGSSNRTVSHFSSMVGSQSAED